MATKQQKHVVIYCRVSKDDDKTMDSVTLQEKRGRAYSAEHWPDLPVKVYIDNDKSAADPNVVRHDYQRFLEDARRGLVAQVVSRNQARLTRQNAEWEELMPILERAGVTETHGYLDGVTPIKGRKLFGRIKVAVDADYIETIIANVNERLADNVENGVPTGGTIFGYAHHDEHDNPYLLPNGHKTMIIIPQQAEAIRWAAEKVLAGWSLSNIAAELRKQGLTGSHGGKIGVSAVRSMVTNPTISGWRVHYGKVVGKGNWEPILDDAIRLACVAKLDSNRVVRRKDGGDYEIGAAHRGHAAGRKYLTTGGLAQCDVCDVRHPMTGSVKTRKKGVPGAVYLLCMPKGRVAIKMKEVDDYVVKEMLDRLDNKKFREQYAADNHSAERDAINAGLEAVARKREKLAELWDLPEDHPDAMNTDEYQFNRRIQAKREQELRAQLDAVPAPPTDIDITKIRADWPFMPLDEKRWVMRVFVERITIKGAGAKGGRIGIKWARH